MVNSVFPILLSGNTSFARSGLQKTLSMETILTLIIIVGGEFTATCLMLYRCLHTSERTPEAIAAYEEEHKYVEK